MKVLAGVMLVSIQTGERTVEKAEGVGGAPDWVWMRGIERATMPWHHGRG